MMTAVPTGKIGVLCVDDNPAVADALRGKFSRTPGFEWKGWLPSADGLVAEAERDCPTIVLLDIDMPGKDPFEALAELVERCPDTRVVVFSGHVRSELIDRAIAAGAWGYVSKNDGGDALIRAIGEVMAGEFAFSPEARAASNG